MSENRKSKSAKIRLSPVKRNKGRTLSAAKRAGAGRSSIDVNPSTPSAGGGGEKGEFTNDVFTPNEAAAVIRANYATPNPVVVAKKGKKLSAETANEAKLIKEVCASLAKAGKNEEDLLLNAHKAGVGLNKLRDKFPHGSWCNHLKEHHPSISDTTLDRYRTVAIKFPTLGDLKKCGIKTLMDAYRACGLIKDKNPTKDGASNPKDDILPDLQLMNILAKAAKHFDHPEQLAAPEKDSLKRAMIRLVEVFNQVQDDDSTWTRAESDVITALYNKIQAKTEKE